MQLYRLRAGNLLGGKALRGAGDQRLNLCRREVILSQPRGTGKPLAPGWVRNSVPSSTREGIMALYLASRSKER